VKIVTLNLQAFGPFTDAVLDLSQGREGLHLIYGPNEAGKSSALRAVRDLLYGIPARSPDNFVHPHPKMRIAAAVRHSDGSELRFIRRKGNAGTLREEDDGAPLDDDRLDKFLGGVDADLFATMFGIDHPRLVRGGQDIARGEGRIGEILFAAGSGVADLRKVQQQLQAETDLLFKSGGQKQTINEAIKLLHKARADLKTLQLSSDEWSRHRQTLEDARRRKEELDGELGRNRREESRLARIRAAVPAIARWKQLRADLDPYRDAPLLPEDFGQKRSEAITRLRTAERQRDESDEAIERIDRQLDTLDVAEGVLEQAEAIEQLRDRVGSYRKAMTDRPGLDNAREMAERDAREILKKLGRPVELEEAEKLRLPADKTTRIHELANQQQALVGRVDAARKLRDQKRRSIAEIDEKLLRFDATADTAQLRQVVRRIRQQGDVENQCLDARDELKRLEQDSAVRLAQLGLWSGTLDELERLSVPSDETLDRFDQQFRDLDVRLDNARQRRRAEEETFEKLLAEIRRLDLAQAVPTEEDLAQARKLRQEGWRLVCQAWLEGVRNGPDVEAFLSQFDSAGDLAEAYQRAVEMADELADRLRREADRVAGKAKLQADRDRTAEACRTLEAELQVAEDEAAALQRQWNELWTPLGIAALPPREMRSWAGRQRKLAELAADLRRVRSREGRLAEQIDSDRRDLAERLFLKTFGLSVAAESLSAMIERAETFLDEAEARRRDWERLRDSLDERRGELQEAEADYEESGRLLADWQQKWADAIGQLGLDQDATAAQANTVIANVNELFVKLHDADNYGLRLEGIDQDAKQFTADVQAMVQRVARELADADVDEAMTAITGMLNKARDDQAERNSLRLQRAQSANLLEKSAATISEADSKLKAMCQQAGCRQHEELAEAQRRSDRRRELEGTLRTIEDQILSHSGGATLDDFVRQAEAVDPDALGSQIDALGEKIRGLERELTEVNQAIGAQRQELDRMDGNAAAAEKADECEAIVAQLDQCVRRYAVLRLAAAVLREGIERYRAKHQGPILDAAGRLFARLTAGSFEGLRTDFDASGQLVLLGVRPGGKETLGVEAMSDGSCDQLYLALRLASIENWLESHEPIPLVVDDVLLNFDDRRACRALEALGELSGRTQVIFFTHHRHLVEMAEATLGPDTLFCHRLENAAVVGG
jgi:uncharacterized protein YhaN